MKCCEISALSRAKKRGNLVSYLHKYRLCRSRWIRFERSPGSMFRLNGSMNLAGHPWWLRLDMTNELGRHTLSDMVKENFFHAAQARSMSGAV